MGKLDSPHGPTGIVVDGVWYAGGSWQEVKYRELGGSLPAFREWIRRDWEQRDAGARAGFAPPPSTLAGPSDPIAQLAAICDESGLTRTEVAARAGMSPGDLSRMLSGRRRVSLDLVRRVLEACGARWGDLDS